MSTRIKAADLHHIAWSIQQSPNHVEQFLTRLYENSNDQVRAETRKSDAYTPKYTKIPDRDSKISIQHEVNFSSTRKQLETWQNNTKGVNQQVVICRALEDVEDVGYQHVAMTFFQSKYPEVLVWGRGCREQMPPPIEIKTCLFISILCFYITNIN